MRVELGAVLDKQLASDSALSSSDYQVLVALSEAHEDRLRIGELAAAVRWEKSRLSHHLTRMARRGLLVREDCPDDARGSYVRLTTEGRRTIERAAPAHVEAVRRYFIDALSVQQLEALAEITEAVLGQVARLD